MDRTERLLDLVALLLDATEPLTWAQLREAFPDDYGQGSDEASERKFERDKAELLELGIPITYVQGDDERKDGYVVERDAYYLPEAGLAPEELAVLYAAGSAALASGAFPGRQDLAHALRKIGFYAGGELSAPKVRVDLGGMNSPDLAATLEQLWSAAAARKFASMSYYSPRRGGAPTERRVDPYGLALRGGVWSLVGYCHLRQGIRTFHVHRIRRLQVNPSKPRSPDFEVPPDFKLDDYVASYVWQHRFHEPVDVELRLSGELARIAEGAVPAAKLLREGPAVKAIVRATYLDGLLRYALSLGPECEIVAPPSAVERARGMLEKILAAHGDAAEEVAG